MTEWSLRVIGRGGIAWTPFYCEKVFFVVVAWLAAGNEVRSRAATASNERYQMIHR